MESEAILKLIIWPAWILLFCSMVLLVGAFARAFHQEFRRLLPSRGAETGTKESDSMRL